MDFMNEHELNCGLIMFDIDHFKNINDSHGHVVGDKVLSEIARRCSIRLRKDDPLVRWGGEEFLVLIRRADYKDIVCIAEDLRLAISTNPLQPVGKVTASFGVTQIFPTESVSSSLQRVDEALYVAKNDGRNKVFSH